MFTRRITEAQRVQTGDSFKMGDTRYYVHGKFTFADHVELLVAPSRNDQSVLTTVKTSKKTVFNIKTR